MNRRTTLDLTIMSLLATSMLAAAGPTFAAEVTPDRLVDADKEPQNWLMNHRTYDSQRYSPLDKINHGNVKSLKLAYASSRLPASPAARPGRTRTMPGRPAAAHCG